MGLHPRCVSLRLSRAATPQLALYGRFREEQGEPIFEMGQRVFLAGVLGDLHAPGATAGTWYPARLLQCKDGSGKVLFCSDARGDDGVLSPAWLDQSLERWPLEMLVAFDPGDVGWHYGVDRATGRGRRYAGGGADPMGADALRRGRSCVCVCPTAKVLSLLLFPGWRSIYSRQVCFA